MYGDSCFECLHDCFIVDRVPDFRCECLCSYKADHKLGTQMQDFVLRNTQYAALTIVNKTTGRRSWKVVT
eukprot:IDg5758t1